MYKSGRVIFDKPSIPGISANNCISSSNKRKKTKQYDISEFERDIACDNDNEANNKDIDTVIEDNKSAWEESGKLLVLAKVLPLWFTEGHKVLIFSQTHSMLNLIEVMMKHFQFRYMRLDGSTPISKRAGIYLSISIFISMLKFIYISLYICISLKVLSIHLIKTPVSSSCFLLLGQADWASH